MKTVIDILEESKIQTAENNQQTVISKRFFLMQLQIIQPSQTSISTTQIVSVERNLLQKEK